MEVNEQDKISATTAVAVTDVESKVKSAFGSYVVRKELVHSYEITRLPRFISEYLIYVLQHG